MGEPFPVETQPRDGEMEYEIELLVRLKGFGKVAGRHKLAESVQKALCLSLHQKDEDVEVFYQNRRVNPPDHREPEGTVPWYDRERNPCA